MYAGHRAMPTPCLFAASMTWTVAAHPKGSTNKASGSLPTNFSQTLYCHFRQFEKTQVTSKHEKKVPKQHEDMMVSTPLLIEIETQLKADNILKEHSSLLQHQPIMNTHFY